MINFPLTVVDNFLENPDKVRNFALHQEFFKDNENKYPGKRTKHIGEIDPFFFNELMKKVFSLYFNYNYEELHWSIDAKFQLSNSSKTKGWIHRDKSKVTGLIYLSPNANLNNGTSIYKAKNNILYPNLDMYTKEKHSFFAGLTSYDEHEKYIKLNNEQFVETINIGNVYNRLVLFDSHEYHAAQDFLNDSNEQRLTLIFFVYGLFIEKLPIEKSKFYKI